MTVGTVEPTTRRNIAPLEWETIGKLAAEAPDLTQVEARLLLALKPGDGPSGGPLLRPATWRELMEAVKLGVLGPGEARRFVGVPGAERGSGRSWWLPWQRGGSR